MAGRGQFPAALQNETREGSQGVSRKRFMKISSLLQLRLRVGGTDELSTATTLGVLSSSLYFCTNFRQQQYNANKFEEKGHIKLLIFVLGQKPEDC